MKSTESSSQQEANHKMWRSRQWRSMAGAELDAVAVFDVGHAAPGGVALEVPLVAGHALLGGAFLELDRVGPGQHGAVDEAFGQLHRAVVVDADLGDHEHRVAVPHPAIANPHFRSITLH
jgi:hypothetical protein